MASEGNPVSFSIIDKWENYPTSTFDPNRIYFIRDKQRIVLNGEVYSNNSAYKLQLSTGVHVLDVNYQTTILNSDIHVFAMDVEQQPTYAISNIVAAAVTTQADGSLEFLEYSTNEEGNGILVTCKAPTAGITSGLAYSGLIDISFNISLNSSEVHQMTMRIPVVYVEKDLTKEDKKLKVSILDGSVADSNDTYPTYSSVKSALDKKMDIVSGISAGTYVKVNVSNQGIVLSGKDKIGDSDLENITLIDNQASECALPVDPISIYDWLQVIRDDIKYLNSVKITHTDDTLIGTGLQSTPIGLKSPNFYVKYQGMAENNSNNKRIYTSSTAAEKLGGLLIPLSDGEISLVQHQIVNDIARVTLGDDQTPSAIISSLRPVHIDASGVENQLAYLSEIQDTRSLIEWSSSDIEDGQSGKRFSVAEIETIDNVSLRSKRVYFSKEDKLLKVYNDPSTVNVYSGAHWGDISILDTAPTIDKQVDLINKLIGAPADDQKGVRYFGRLRNNFVDKLAYEISAITSDGNPSIAIKSIVPNTYGLSDDITDPVMQGNIVSSATTNLIKLLSSDETIAISQISGDVDFVVNKVDWSKVVGSADRDAAISKLTADKISRDELVDSVNGIGLGIFTGITASDSVITFSQKNVNSSMPVTKYNIQFLPDKEVSPITVGTEVVNTSTTSTVKVKLGIDYITLNGTDLTIGGEDINVNILGTTFTINDNNGSGSVSNAATVNDITGSVFVGNSGAASMTMFTNIGLAANDYTLVLNLKSASGAGMAFGNAINTWLNNLGISQIGRTGAAIINFDVYNNIMSLWKLSTATSLICQAKWKVAAPSEELQ